MNSHVCNAATYAQLEALPILADCHRRSLARLIPLLQEKKLEAGETLFNSGELAETMYYVLTGKLTLFSGQRCVDKLSQAFVGEEAALGADTYLSTAVADETVQLLGFPKQAMQELQAENPKLGPQLYQSLVNHRSDKQHPFQLMPSRKSAKIKESWSIGIGWLLAILLPALVYYLTKQAGLPWTSINFLTIFSAAVVMWVFRLVPEYIPALFIVMTVIILDLVPTDTILAGYSSGSFFMALSVFGIGAALVQSGLTYRITLLILRRLPKSGFWYEFAIFIIGIFLTPVLPSANGRTSLISPLVEDMIEVLGYRSKGSAATQLTAAAFAGISIFSACFLTAKSINFALFGLFPTQVKDQFTWGYWLYASGVAFAVMFVLYFILSKWLFGRDETPHLSKQHLCAQLQILGPISIQEWVALLGIFLFLVGVMTASIHKIQPPWIGLAILYILLTLGSISKKGFRQEIDWPFLLMLGGFVGLVKTMSFLGIDVWFAQHLAWIGKFMGTDFPLFVLMLAVAMYLIRLVVPNSAAIILVASIFMPLAQHHGINPWIIGFVVLMFSDGWFMPYQCSYYLPLLSEGKLPQLFDHKSLLVFNAWSNLIRFAAVYASIPFWKSIGLL